MRDAQTPSWRDAIDRTLPCWEDYQEVLSALWVLPCDDALPDSAALESLLGQSTTNLKGKAIRFVTPSSLPPGNYEAEIFDTGRVSTREDCWHDLFNALVWSQFPNIKAAMNAVHVSEMREQLGTRRGSQRDALTLWDECGVIVVSTDRQLLEDLTQRNWHAAFRQRADAWRDATRTLVCGHAMLEKFLNPYKSVTAKALLIHLNPESFFVERVTLRAALDRTLASMLVKGELLRTTRDLSPLPLAGIPGWWKNNLQNDEFYTDDQVFRDPPERYSPAPIIELSMSHNTAKSE